MNANYLSRMKNSSLRQLMKMKMSFLVFSYTFISYFLIVFVSFVDLCPVCYDFYFFFSIFPSKLIKLYWFSFWRSFKGFLFLGRFLSFDCLGFVFNRYLRSINITFIHVSDGELSILLFLKLKQGSTRKFGRFCQSDTFNSPKMCKYFKEMLLCNIRS